MNVIATVGMVGLAIGPTAGGFVLAVAPLAGPAADQRADRRARVPRIRSGIAADDPAGLHRNPIDVSGALLGTATIVCALVAPTLFVGGSGLAWPATAAAVAAGILFVARERTARHPLLDLELIAHPLVSSGLVFKAATGLAIAGLGYLVTLQLQLDWGWSAGLASLGMLPQVVVLLAGGAVLGPFVQRVGLERAAWISSAVVVAGLAVFALTGRFGYIWVTLALVLVAACMRVAGVVAGTNVLRGLPANRTTIGAALVDTSAEVTTAVGIAASGTILAAMFTGSIATTGWTAHQTTQFHHAVTVAGLTITLIAAALVGWGIARSRDADTSAPTATVAAVDA